MGSRVAYHNINVIVMICLCLLSGVLYCTQLKPCSHHRCMGPRRNCPVEYCTCGEDDEFTSVNDDNTERFCSDRNPPPRPPLWPQPPVYNGPRHCFLSSCIVPILNCPTDYCSCFDESGNESDGINVERFCNDKPSPVQPQLPDDDLDNPMQQRGEDDAQPQLHDDDTDDPVQQIGEEDDAQLQLHDDYTDDPVQQIGEEDDDQPQVPDDSDEPVQQRGKDDCTSKPTFNDPDDPCEDDCFCDNSIAKCEYMSDYIDYSGGELQE